MNQYKQIEICHETSDSEIEAKLSQLNPVYSSEFFNVYTDSLTYEETELLNSLSEQNLKELTMKNQKFSYRKACSFCKALTLYGEVNYELLEEAVENVKLEILQIEPIEKIRYYEPIKSTTLKVIKEALFPQELCEFGLSLEAEELKILKINTFKGTLKQYQYILGCRELQSIELPVFIDETADIITFIQQIFINNNELEFLSSEFGEVLALKEEDLLQSGTAVYKLQEDYSHKRYRSHIRAFSEYIDSDNESISEVSSFPSQEESFNEQMMIAKQRLSLVKEAKLKELEVIEQYFECVCRGIFVQEEVLGFEILNISRDKKFFELFDASDRGPYFIYENMQKIKPEKYKINEIFDYFSGSESEPMNHQYLSLRIKTESFCFKVEEQTENTLIDLCDESIAFVEALRNINSQEILFGNVLCKYLNRKYPGEYDLKE